MGKETISTGNMLQSNIATVCEGARSAEVNKDYVIKTIFFTKSGFCQTFLIVTTAASLFTWKDQFNKWASHINAAVYGAGKDMLKSIQYREFCENRNDLKLQVVLSHPDAIIENIETIAHISWEAVIVDCYQNSALKYLERLKQLSTDFRVLLLSSPIKDNLLEYKNLLAFLDSQEEGDNDYCDDPDALDISKIRFGRHIAYERKAASSNFVEHWFPAYISQVQLEVYSSILLKNKSILQSQMKTDSIEVLRDILLSLSKCCNHPCLVDANHHKMTETVDIRVDASGKLLLLNRMLTEIDKKKLRVVTFFQSGEAGGNPMGDIIEDVMLHGFGPESYERLTCGATMSKKQAAISMFNDKTKGRFVLLIESRACLPSTKLSSVDAVIIYGSDWDPLNDLKALQRISIASEVNSVSIFRLYTPMTVEENSLCIARQSIITDWSIQDLMHILSHSLISWGRSLNELQKDNCARSEWSTLLMNKVISEFLAKLPSNVQGGTKVCSASVPSGEFYSRSISLMNE